MVRSLVFLASLVSLTLAAGTSTTFAQTATSVKAAREATHHARRFLVNLEARNGSAMRGTVALQSIGATRTRVRVHITNPNPGNVGLSMYRGSDCVGNRGAALANAAAIKLNPIGASQVSETIVDLPIGQIQSGNYLVDVRNATARAQAAAACARIVRPN